MDTLGTAVRKTSRRFSHLSYVMLTRKKGVGKYIYFGMSYKKGIAEGGFTGSGLGAIV